MASKTLMDRDRHHVVGPYYLIADKGLHCDQQPSEEEAEKMLDFLIGYQESVALMWAYFLASLPKEYGKTFHRASQYFNGSESYMDDLRMLGKRCPLDEYDRRWSVSHHMALYVYYDLTPEQRDHYRQVLEDHYNSPGANGHTLSVAKLRDIIRRDLDLLPAPDPKDKDYLLQAENQSLSQDLFETRGKMALFEEVMERDVLPLIAELSGQGIALPDGLAQSVAKVRSFIEQNQAPNGSKWIVIENPDGGVELAYRTDDIINAYQYAYEPLPDDAKDELVRLLRAERRK